MTWQKLYIRLRWDHNLHNDIILAQLDHHHCYVETFTKNYPVNNLFALWLALRKNRLLLVMKCKVFRLVCIPCSLETKNCFRAHYSNNRTFFLLQWLYTQIVGSNEQYIFMASSSQHLFKFLYIHFRRNNTCDKVSNSFCRQNLLLSQTMWSEE